MDDIYNNPGERLWSSNKNGNLSLPMHSRSFSSLPPHDGSSLADGECGRAQNDPSIIAYKKIVHHDDGNVGKQKNRMMALQLLFVRKGKE